MAITASITTIPSSGTISPNQKLKGVVTVTNGNATPVEVLGVDFYAARTGQTTNSTSSVNPVEVQFSGRGNVQNALLAPNGGTTNLSFDVIFFAPRQGSTLTNPATVVYDVGASVYTSDGSATNATVQTLTITAPST